MADILLHVLDASSEKIHEQDEAVYKVLKELEAENKIVIDVLNKIDLVDSPDRINRLKKDFENAVLVSALKGSGIVGAISDRPLLIDEIQRLLSALVTEIKIDVPNNRMDLVSLIYENGKVNYREDRLESVYLEATIPVRLKHLI